MEVGVRFLPDIDAFCRARIGKPRGKSFELSSLGVFDLNGKKEVEAVVDDSHGHGDVNGNGNETVNENENGRASGKKENWSLGRMIFSQSSHAPCSPITLSVVTGGDGACVLGFTWQEGVVFQDMMDQLMDIVSKQVVEVSLDLKE
ncbi:hypothetical protein DL95DRAFT_419105 [Leptodontidium sp. 2 PMI_412]|nr:hypothetical protein DL95DRAFT_419105 [Leptodontidium sp. 2 PMI_412]